MGECALSVVCRPRGCDVLEVVVHGVLTQASIPLAMMEAIPRMNEAGACVLRLDAAVFALTRLPKINLAVYHGSATPCALIVQPGSYEFWQAWACLLAQEAGLVRAVFLPQHTGIALQWAADHAAARREKSRPLPLSPPRSCRAGQSAYQTTLQAEGLRA
jgi:hypothetical protein